MEDGAMTKDWIVCIYEGQNFIMDIGLIGNTEGEAIENAKSDLIDNLDYDPGRVQTFRYEAKLDPLQEGTPCEDCPYYNSCPYGHEPVEHCGDLLK